jgi:hypothetical protein
LHVAFGAANEHVGTNEAKLLLELRRASSRLQALTLEPIEFLEENPDKEFKDSTYQRRHIELTTAIDRIIDALNELHRKRNAH